MGEDVQGLGCIRARVRAFKGEGIEGLGWLTPIREFWTKNPNSGI